MPRSRRGTAPTQEDTHVATLAPRPVRGRARRRAAHRPGPRRRTPAAALLLLPVLLLPPQLLADQQPGLARAARLALPAAAGLHGVPAVPGVQLALHALLLAPLLQRPALLARPVLRIRRQKAVSRRRSRAILLTAFGLLPSAF